MTGFKNKIKKRNSCRPRRNNLNISENLYFRRLEFPLVFYFRFPNLFVIRLPQSLDSVIEILDVYTGSNICFKSRLTFRYFLKNDLFVPIRMRFADDHEQIASGQRRRRWRRPFLQRRGIRRGIQQRFRARSILSRTRILRRGIFGGPRGFRRSCRVLHARRPGALIFLSRRFRFVVSLKQKKDIFLKEN